MHGAAPAPYTALDLIAGAQEWTIEEGYEREQEAIGELLPGPQAQASLYAFQLVELRAKKHPARPTAPPLKVNKVGIVGAGLMARQIATLFLRRLEVPIVIRDVKQEIVDEALADIRAEIDGQVAKGRYDEGKGRFLSSLVSGSTDYDGFADCDLVLEAVFEELEVKKQVFAELEQVVRDECVLATNTSALSITDMAADLRRPERVAGMHFFNPVALMPLLEVVRAAETDDVTLATVWDVGEKLRKRPILVNDAPGFVVNRVLTRMTRVIMDAVEHGTPVEEVDEAVMSLGMPMAPSVLLQMVGPRVANHVLERMHDAFPERFPLSPALAAIADGGEPVVARRRAAQRASRSSRTSSRPWPTRSISCSRKASSPKRPTSTRASCSAPAGRSSSAGSRSTSTRSACRSACSATPSPTWRLRLLRDRTGARHGYETVTASSQKPPTPQDVRAPAERTGARHGYVPVTRAARK